MEKCSKCGSVISDNDPMAWKCTECGKAFRVSLSKLKKLKALKDKPENAGKMLLKCSACGNGIDNGNEKIACKCSACGNVMMGKLRDFASEAMENHTVNNELYLNNANTYSHTSSKCHYCGSSISKNAKFCTECGSQISSIQNRHHKKTNRKGDCKKSCVYEKKIFLDRN